MNVWCSRSVYFSLQIQRDHVSTYLIPQIKYRFSFVFIWIDLLVVIQVQSCPYIIFQEDLHSFGFCQQIIISEIQFLFSRLHCGCIFVASLVGDRDCFVKFGWMGYCDEDNTVTECDFSWHLMLMHWNLELAVWMVIYGWQKTWTGSWQFSDSRKHVKLMSAIEIHIPVECILVKEWSSE